MALYVNTNVSSINAQRKLTGLMISDRLTSQINGLNQGNRNANDGIALAQTIEGALDETTNMLQRIRTLAVQSANGTNGSEDRKALQQEVNQLCAEINRIAADTTFAGKTILDGADNGTASTSLIPEVTGGAGSVGGKLIFHVGSNQGDTIELDWRDAFNMDGIADMASLSDGKDLDANPAFTTATVDGEEIHVWGVSTQSDSENVLGEIDKFIQYVDSRRSELGAIQNRMEATIRNQSNISENESDARSRIRDTDFASETAALTQNNIIQQASQTVLAQANQRPTIALSLLGQ